MLTGAAGSGKTGLILSLVEASCFGESVGASEGNLGRMAARVVAYHFCQADNAPTCLVPEMVHSLAAQLSQAPQLAAYYRHLKASPEARALVSLASCRANPSRALVQGVLQPLTRLHSPGQLPSSPLLLLVDGLCEAEQHRPDTGPSLLDFLASHLPLLPPWLRLVATSRSPGPSSLPLERLRLDGLECDGDLAEYIKERCTLGPSIVANIRGSQGDPVASLSSHLLARARGCLLYVKLVLDFIEKGSLVIKSGSFKVLPQTLSEAYHLAFSLKFSSLQAYGPAQDLLASSLACLAPPSLEELHASCSALSVAPLVWTDFTDTYAMVSEWLVGRRDGSLMLLHPTLRDWLLARREGDSTKFLVNTRTGHTALALAWARQPGPLRPDKILQLGHHILKASLFKGLGEGDLTSRNLQATFLALACGDPSPGLACPSNLSSPLLKVSRLLLLAGADPDLTTEDEGQVVSLLALHAGRGHLAMVSLLLEFCAGVSPPGQAPSALVLACRGGHTEVARLLLACGAREVAVALLEAGAAGHLDLVKLLAQEVEEGLQEVLVTALAHHQVEVAAWLLKQPAVSPDLAASDGRRPLEVAAGAGSRRGVELVLEQGGGLEGGALHQAVEGGHYSVTEVLLARGADPDTLDCGGQSVLSVAARGGRCSLIELLVSRGAGPGGGRGEVVPPLAHALLHGSQEAVSCLLELGASASAGDGSGRSGLDLAVHTGRPDLVTALLEVTLECDPDTTS